MKKNLIIAAIAGAFLLPVVACGPSAEEKQAQEQAMKDSIAEAAKQAVEDSIAAATAEQLKIQAEMEEAAAKQAEMDSIANAEKSKPKAATKPKATQPKPEAAPAPEAPKVGKKKPGAN